MDPVTKIFISIGLVTVILSLPGNFFIIVVNLLDFCKNRRLPVNDWLILGFSVFSLLYAFHEGYVLYTDLFPLSINGSDDMKDENIMLYSIVSTLWFSAILSVHFCLKIVSANHWFYIGLQRRFHQLCPWVIVAFLLGFFSLSLYSEIDTKSESLLNTTSGDISMKNLSRYSWLTLIFLAFCILCALLCSVSASTILISLLKHIRSIKKNTEGFRSPSIEAHIRAVRTITTLLASNILIFTAVFILTLHHSTWVYLFGILIFICHILSSYFLIKGTKKLDKTLSEILSWCSCAGGNSQ